MTLEEYRQETATAIRKVLSNEAQEEVEKLIELLQKIQSGRFIVQKQAKKISEYMTLHRVDMLTEYT